MGRFQEKQLAQSRPSGTSAASIYSPPASTTAIIKTIIIANVGSGSVDASLFCDDDGTTYDESTSIYWEVSIANGNTTIIDTYICMDDATGNFAVQSSSGNDLTFTIFGVEIT